MRVDRILVLFACLLALSAGILTITSPVHAQTGVNSADFGFSPDPADATSLDRGFFIYQVDSGAQTQGAVVIENKSEAPLTINLAAADAFTAQGGGSAFSPINAAPTGSGSWLSVEKSTLTLAPGEQERVSFSVQVPTQTLAGQYLAGITAYSADQDRVSDGTDIPQP